MLNKIIKIIFLLFCISGVVYLALPNRPFPGMVPDALVSQEPADLETPFRRGYYTNLSRQDVLNWYKGEFNYQVFGIKLPIFLLNYPPEYAQDIIRDQTGSTFLQEYVHPFRESIYINGFKPQTSDGKPVFLINGEGREQKIIVRYVPSNILLREVIFIVSMIMFVIIYKELTGLIKKQHE